MNKIKKPLSTAFYILLAVVNLIIFKSRQQLVGLNKSNCDDSLLNAIQNNKFDLYEDKITQKFDSIIPEIFDFQLFKSKCFGSVSDLIVEDFTTTVIFISNQYLFFISFLLINLLAIFFLYLSGQEIKEISISYIIIFFTLFNFLNFDYAQLSFVFSIIFSYSIIVIIFKAVFFKKLFSEKLQKANLLIYLISWVSIILLEHEKLLFSKLEFYHFKLWLINYSQGYNRRGLIGQIIYLFGKFFDLRYVLLFLFLLILSGISIYIYKIFTENKQNILSYFLLFSPAFLSFHILDIRGSMRKEILGFLAYLMLLYFIEKKKNIFFPVLIYTIAVFSHPANIFIAPFSIGLMIKNKIDNKKIILFTIPLLFYIFSGVLYSPNNSFQPETFCKEVNSQINTEISCELLDSGDLEGVINDNINDYISLTKENISFKQFRFYLTSLLFAIFPLIFSKKFFLKNNYLLLSFVPYLFLFFIGFDWGRWISLFVSLLTVAYFNNKDKESNKPSNIMMFLFLLFFIFSWDIPHCCIENDFPTSSNMELYENIPLVTITELVFSEIFNLN